MSLAYLDASAFVKLIVSEAESQALRQALEGSQTVSSAVLGVEGRRACRRYGAHAAHAAERALAGVIMLPLDRAAIAAAAAIEPAALRTLDAIHIAAARSVEDEISTLYAYDERLLDAARAAGLPVHSPGR